MKFLKVIIALFLTTFLFAQNAIPKVLEQLNSKSVPYITVEQLRSKGDYILLDAREKKEFNVSHIKNAIHVGFDKFDSKKVAKQIQNKNAPIVVYCSIGVRSEKIGEKLQKLGYKNVYNLYGGIFEWKNDDRKVVNNHNKETDSVHAYNKEWSAYLKKGVKVYEN